MQLDRPFLLLGPTVDGDVLSKLALAEAEFTPPQVHRLIDRHSVEGVRNALQRLTEQGIVLQRRAGMARLYQLNQASIEETNPIRRFLRVRLGSRLWVDRFDARGATLPSCLRDPLPISNVATVL